MSWRVEFCENRATEGQIAGHLSLCDAKFVPPLSSRVRIEEYAHKIYVHGVRLEAWADDSLIGLLALYCNQDHEGVAFITSVSVTATLENAHIGSQLLERGIEYVVSHRFDRVDLEVGKGNHRAIRLYKRYGFIENAANERSLFMTLELRRRSE